MQNDEIDDFEPVADIHEARALILTQRRMLKESRDYLMARYRKDQAVSILLRAMASELTQLSEYVDGITPSREADK